MKAKRYIEVCTVTFERLIHATRDEDILLYLDGHYPRVQLDESTPDWNETGHETRVFTVEEGEEIKREPKKVQP